MFNESIRDVPIPGGWEETAIELAGRRLSILLPANADGFLDHIESVDQPLHIADPYWARLWPAARTMAEMVVQQEWPNSAHALELGCGIGIVGLAGLLRGLRVTFSDQIELAVELACENARRNGFADCAGQVLDWKHPPRDRYSVILASDVLYDPKLHETLLALLDGILDQHGTCWIGDPGRFHCEAFICLAELRGYRVSLRDQNGQDQQRVTVGEFCLLAMRRA
jgi:predicted nicotinamide N-methyase